jgi:hypothetical protein
MTTVKLDSKVGAGAGQALERHVPRLYANLGTRIVGVVELAVVERTEPAPDEDKDPSVKLAIKHLEVANDEQDETVRKAMRALHVQRTARGTLTEDGDIELSDQTLRLVGDMLHDIEAARLRVLADSWARYAEQATMTELTVTQLREELVTVARGLRAGLGYGGGE